MQFSGNQSGEVRMLEAEAMEIPVAQDEAKWFMVWAGLWLAALAVLLPALL